VDQPPDSIFFGIIVGAAWVLREVLPLLLKKRPEPEPKDTAAADLKAFIARFDATERDWERWRQNFEGTTNRRFDAHSERINELAAARERDA